MSTGTSSKQLLIALVAVVFASCANRGMYSVTGDGGTGGAGTGGMAGGGGTGGGMGGGGGTTCVPSSGADAGSCTATFNFENCALYGATLDPSQPAFTAIANVRTPTSCGSGAMEISATFGPPFLPDGAANSAVLGGLTIPFSGDLRGKTITIHVMAIPATSSLTTFYLYPFTSERAYDSSILKTSPIPSTWTTKSFTFPDTTDAGLMEVVSLLVQARSLDSYVGHIYIDEIDITSAPQSDGGADGVTDSGSADAPKDAPADTGGSDGPRDTSGN